VPKTTVIPNLTVVINTKNAEETLAHTIQSVRDYVAEVLVIDTKSTDKTVKIAEAAGAKVFAFHKDEGYVEPARNFAIAKAKTDWVFLLDADETVPPTLWPKIEEMVLEEKNTLAGYYLPRQNWILGAKIKSAGWWPDYQLRVFRKTKIQWPERIHAVPAIDGPTEKLPALDEFAIIHQNYSTVESYIDRLNTYTSKEPKLHQQRDVTGASLVNVVAADLLRRMFADRGLEGGAHGVGLSFLQSFYQLATEMKHWQMQDFPEIEPPEVSALRTIRALQQFQRDLNYWIADYQVQRTKGLAQMWWRLRRKVSL
jgi:glycosyltransferase involved in cell wall biosynthesis